MSRLHCGIIDICVLKCWRVRFGKNNPRNFERRRKLTFGYKNKNSSLIIFINMNCCCRRVGSREPDAPLSPGSVLHHLGPRVLSAPLFTSQLIPISEEAGRCFRPRRGADGPDLNLRPRRPAVWPRRGGGGDPRRSASS